MPNYKDFDLDIRNEKNNLKSMNSKKRSDGGTCYYSCGCKTNEGNSCGKVCFTDTIVCGTDFDGR